MIFRKPEFSSRNVLRGAALLMSALIASAAFATQSPPVGVKVYVQAWNPLAPTNDVPATAFASRDGISSAMNAAWDEGRKILSDGSQRGSLRWRLEQPNLIARGITLRFLSFNLNPLGPIDLQPAGIGGFRIHWSIPDSYFDFKSTTPSAGGVGVSRDADPEFSFRFDLDITLGTTVSDATGGTLITVTNVSVVPSHLNFDAHNLSGDAVKAAADAVSTFMKGEAFNSLLNQTLSDKNLAAGQNNGGYDLAKMANAKLQPLNAQIASSGAAKYVRVGLWARQGASGQALGLLFGVKALPLPAATAGIAGTLQFIATPGQAARPLPASCDGLFQKGEVDVEVQRGPRPVLDADPLTDMFSYGTAPISAIANVVFTGGAVSNGECAYRLAGLSVWPNQISFPPPTVKGNGNDAASAAFWDVRAKSGVTPLVTCATQVRDTPSSAKDVISSVKSSPFIGGYAGSSGGGACAGSYDLVARSAVAIDTGKIAGRMKYVRPGDAVQNSTTYQNAETTSAAYQSAQTSGAVHSNSPQAAQTSVWGAQQTQMGSMQTAGGSRPTSSLQPAATNTQQKPNWSAPSSLGRQ